MLSDALHCLAGISWVLASFAIGAALGCAMSERRRFVRPLLITAVVLSFAVLPLAEFGDRAAPETSGTPS